MMNSSLRIRGRVVAKLGDNVDTDVIYPGRYLNITDREKTGEHLFELAYPEIRRLIRPGDVIVAGKNFGCGSSREQATAALKYSRVGAVIAASFARIFFRNSVNLGLPLLVSAEAAERLETGDDLLIDPVGGRILNLDNDEAIQAAPLDPRAIELLQAGGLVPYLKKKYA
ncbi:MAG: 3-isopropylmalate dehydratase small subunit [Acidobacteria bacterium]|nr:3-isopropylmalate dehydratase small subunit [Acidobacteriota bacterium]